MLIWQLESDLNEARWNAGQIKFPANALGLFSECVIQANHFKESSVFTLHLFKMQHPDNF